MALGTRTKFQLEILIRSTTSANTQISKEYFGELVKRQSNNPLVLYFSDQITLFKMAHQISRNIQGYWGTGTGTVRGTQLGPFDEKYFTHYSKMIANSLCSNSTSGYEITTNCCTCHDSTAVMSGRKYVRIIVTTPPPPWLPILVIHIRSQVKTSQSQSYKFQKLVKIWIFKFCKVLYTWHTFWSCLIRCINMKWIQQKL